MRAGETTGIGVIAKQLNPFPSIDGQISTPTHLLIGGFAMEAHAFHGRVHWRPQSNRIAAATVIEVGAIAGMAAGMMMAMWQMIVGAIAQNPTAVPGIHQSFWTPVEGIWSVVFGVHHFHGDFHLIPVFGGIAGHMMNSMMLGIMGVAISTTILGRRPNRVAAVMLGVGFGIAVEAILVNGIINTQKIETLYSSTPHWSWWAAHAIFGMTLGLLSSLLLRRSSARHPRAPLAAG